MCKGDTIIVYFDSCKLIWLYKGIDGKGGVTSSDDTSQSSNSSQGSLNDALFEDDHFHPNNTGYQIMSDAILKRINQTKKEWSGE